MASAKAKKKPVAKQKKPAPRKKVAVATKKRPAPPAKKKVPDPRPTPRPTPDMSGRSLLPLNILLIGPPRAGKGTQAEKISATSGIPPLRRGTRSRAATPAGTPRGKQVEPL